MTTELQENRRLQIQAVCDAERNQFERNRLGQFATRPDLALQVVDYAVGLMPNRQQIDFLDPAVGTGAFFSALLSIAGGRRIRSAVGFEIDRAYGVAARELWSAKGLQVRLRDF